MRLQAVALFPPQFNEQVQQYGGKGEVLTRQTLELVRHQMATLESEPVLIQCDKHGGRNYYGSALQEAFPEYLVEVRRESRAQSVYRWGPPAAADGNQVYRQGGLVFCQLPWPRWQPSI